MRGVVSFLVAASAIAFHGPVPTSRTRRVCNVRGSPGIARLGEMLGDNNPLQALDTMKPTLSFVGFMPVYAISLPDTRGPTAH